MRLWRYVERWLPALVALAAVLGVVLVGWTQGERLATLEGAARATREELDRRTQLEVALRLEVQTLQAHVVVLNREMIKAGLTPPPPPSSGGEQGGE